MPNTNEEAALPFGEKIEFIDYWGEPFALDASLRVTVKGRGEGYLDDARQKNSDTNIAGIGCFADRLSSTD